MMNKPVLEAINTEAINTKAINTETTGKSYIDSHSAEVIIGMITELKRKVADAEELLEMMERVPAEQ